MINEKKEVWDRPNPNKGGGGKMTPAQKAEAKRRAKAAGRPYPNLVDNMAAMKEGTDDEGGMAKGELETIASKAKELSKMMKKNKQLDAWVQSKITKSDDYIGSVHDFLKNGKQEVDEQMTKKTFFTLREQLDSFCIDCDDSIYGSVEEDFEPTGEEQYEDWDLYEANDTDMYHYKHAGASSFMTGKSGTYVGHTHSASKGKGANILKHNKTGKYYAAGGSSTAFTQKTTLHDTPEEAAKAYHDKHNEKLAEANETPLSYMLKNPGKKLPMHLDPNRPFDPDPPKKNPSAVAGKYGQGFSTAKHLAKQGMASIKKEEASPMIKPPTNEFAKKEDAFAHAKKHGGKVMKKTFTHPTSGMKHVSYVVREEAELDEAKYRKLSAHEKFKNSMKRAGYDMDAAAKRLQDLLAKQKKEREEREKQSVAEGVELQEAEKNGKKVQLNKPFRTSDGKGKFAVYTKNDKGNVVKVNFGDTTGLTIKTSNPDRRRSFRARHNCDDPGPKHKARYWSCKAWSRDSVSAGLGT